MAHTAAIPTIHRSRQYRSLLEAKWASFFDELNWSVEYEPFELDGWIPDFLIRGVVGVLVEVKPIYQFDQSVVSKIERAAQGRTEDLLLLGCAPWAGSDWGAEYPVLGWLGEHEEGGWCWGEAPMGLWSGAVGFCHSDCYWGDRISGEHNQTPGCDLSVERLQGRWARACNRVQWRAPA